MGLKQRFSSLLDRRGKRVLKVAIATPCGDTVDAGFAYDLARLTAHVAGTRPDIQLSVHQARGSILPQQRATLVQTAREAQATHILWIDSDMRFPADALDQLLAHDEPIVAANYAMRRHPILPTAKHRDLGFLFTPPGADGLADVTHCGMGLMLTDMAVFANTPEPWFIVGYSPKTGEYSGEDFFFCKRASEHGFATRIDQALSLDVGHAGQFVYRHEHTEAIRDHFVAREQQATIAAGSTATDGGE